MTEEIRPAHPIGKTQWSKWGPEARDAYNHCIRLGFEFATAVEEGNAVQAKVRAKALQELADLGQELEHAARFETVEELMADLNDEPAPTPAVKKPRAPRKKKAE